MRKKSKGSETLKEIGEKEILNRLKIFMDIGQIDDDIATINSSNKDLIVNTDVLVEDVHFNDSTMSPENIGWKAIAANVSDLNASGLNQLIGVTVALITPPETEWNWVDKVYVGMKEALDQFGGKIIGGDCSKGKQKILSITAIGSSGPLRLHRSNAKPGDCLVTTGPHGLSRLGLGLLQSEDICKSQALNESLKTEAIMSHQRPCPPIEAISKLIYCKPKHLPWRAAGTDSSDGLLEALRCICISSKCTAIIELNKIPRAKNWPTGSHWDQWCLSGGEDYQVILSLPQEWAKEWQKTVPSIKTIGEIQEGMPKVLCSNHKEITIKDDLDFKHF